MSARLNPAGPGGQLRPHDNNLDDPANRYSGVGAVGMGFLTGDIDDDDDDDTEIFAPKPTTTTMGGNVNHPPGLTPQGRPGPAVVSQDYSTPPSRPSPTKAPILGNGNGGGGGGLRSIIQPGRGAPAPVQVSFGQQQQQQPRMQMRVPPPAILNLPHTRAPPTPAPMSPHPLQAPKEPIVPAFARPRKQVDSDVKFAPDAILRGDKEETLLPRNTPKGAEFWRRFSVVYKEEQKRPGRLFKSSWLSDHQSRSFRMNLCIWIIGLFLVSLLAGGGVLIWFLTSNNSITAPKSLEGNAGQGVDNSTSTTTTASATKTTFSLATVKGDLAPSTTPPVPAGLTMPTTPPVANPNAVANGALEKRINQSHRRMMRRLAH